MNAKDQPVTPSTTHSLCQIDKSRCFEAAGGSPFQQDRWH
jgi:hypothetical protein